MTDHLRWGCLLGKGAMTGGVFMLARRYPGRVISRGEPTKLSGGFQPPLIPPVKIQDPLSQHKIIFRIQQVDVGAVHPVLGIKVIHRRAHT